MGMLTGVGAKPEEREAADEDGGEDFRYGRREEGGGYGMGTVAMVTVGR